MPRVRSPLSLSHERMSEAAGQTGSRYLMEGSCDASSDSWLAAVCKVFFFLSQARDMKSVSRLSQRRKCLAPLRDAQDRFTTPRDLVQKLKQHVGKHAAL